MSGILGYLSGRSTLVVGVEDDPSGDLRMYLSSRSRGIYALIKDNDAKEELRRAWASSFTGHLVVDWPPADCIYHESERVSVVPAATPEETP